MEKLKKIPSLRFSEFNGNWNNRKIKEILSIGSGRDYKNLGIGEVPVFGTGGLMTKVDSYLNDGETVCIGRKGTIDKPMYFNGKIWTVDTLFFTHSFKESDPKFVYYLFQRVNWKQHNEAGGVPSLSKSTIEQISLSLPPLPEQQKIASFLSAVDEKIQQLSRKKELLEQYKKGVMQQLFPGKLRFKDENGKDYADWEEKRLGDVGSIISGLTYSPDDINEDGILVLRSSNVQNRRLSFQDNVYVKTSAFNPVKLNDILICVRNGSKHLIGKNTIIDKETAGVAFGAFMSVYRSEYNLYIFHYFDTDEYKNEVHKNLGATINSINGSDLKNFKIPFPSIEEQQKIANFLSSVDAKIESTSQQINQTQSFKKGLLQQLFV